MRVLSPEGDPMPNSVYFYLTSLPSKTRDQLFGLGSTTVGYPIGTDFMALDAQTGHTVRWRVIDVRVPRVGENYLRSNGHVTICPRNTVKSERCVVIEVKGTASQSAVAPPPAPRGETVAFRPAWRNKKKEASVADLLKAYDDA